MHNMCLPQIGKAKKSCMPRTLWNCKERHHIQKHYIQRLIGFISPSHLLNSPVFCLRNCWLFCFHLGLCVRQFLLVGKYLNITIRPAQHTARSRCLKFLPSHEHSWDNAIGFRLFNLLGVASHFVLDLPRAIEKPVLVWWNGPDLAIFAQLRLVDGKTRQE